MCKGGFTMKSKKLLVGVFSLAIAGLLYLFDVTAYTWQITSGTMKVYPAAFIALFGVVLVFSALTQKEQTIDVKS